MRIEQTISEPKIRRRAFTLLEILIALALMVFLVLSVSQAVSMYVNLQTFGRNEVEQNQIGRAVLQKIAKDIRSISFAPVDETDFLSDDGMGGSEVDSEDSGDDSGFEDDMMADEDEEPPVETGILGNSEELILYVNRPDRRAQYVAREDAQSPTDMISDSRTVYYYLCRPGSSGIGSEFASTLSQTGSDREVFGLARMEGDRKALNAAIAENDLDIQVEASSLLAEEVVAIQFRYFGNGEWTEEWDSVDSNSLPQAIEITVSVQNVDESESVSTPKSPFVTPGQNSSRSDDEEPIIRKYRRVVAVPLVPPVELEEL